MSQSLYMNNGNIFTVSDVYYTRTLADYPENVKPAGGFNLAPNEPPASFINALDYITPEMQPHSSFGVYGLIYPLTHEDTISEHEYYINLINQNGAFVWGDAYNGGLYVYRSYSATTYGIALFCGRGVSISDPTRDKFYIFNFANAKNLNENQMKWITILHYITADDNNYNLYFGGEYYDNDGDPCTIEAAGTPSYENPLDPTQITKVTYDLYSLPKKLSTLLKSSGVYSVNPLSLSTPNFQTPSEMVTQLINTETYTNVHFIIPTQNIGPVGYPVDPNYKQGGSWWGGDDNIVQDDPNTGKTNSTGGGYGTPSNHSDDVGLPNDNQFGIDAVNSGFVTIYHPTAANMKAFNNWLFASFSENWWDTLKKILQDPLDFVIGAGIVKYVPTTKTANQEIKFNGIGTEVFADTVNQWEKVNCGSVTINEQFNTYLDYNGFSDVKIFLPFCGIQSLDVNDVMGATIHVIYYIDNMTGSCVAQVNVNRAERNKADDSHINSVLYKFSGNVMQQLPLTNKDYASLIGTVTSLATSAVAAASTGGAASLGLASQTAGALEHIKPTIQRSGNLGSNYGMMDYLKPYLILERPIRAIPAEYGSYIGYPAAFTTKLGKCKGFTKGRPYTNWASNIHATDGEKEEIKELIERGIYI